MSLFKPNTPKLFCDGIQTIGDANTWRLYADGIYTGDVARVTLTTTRNGLFTATLKGASGSVWFDWGEGGALEEFVLIPGGVACTNIYGDASEKTITITGDLENITSWVSDGMSINANLSFISPLTSLTVLYLQSNQITGSLSALAPLTGLTSLRIYSNSINGSLSYISGLTSLTAVYAYSTYITGNLSELDALVSLVILWINSTNIGCSSDALYGWDGTNFRLYSCGWTSTEVDNCLIQMAAAGVANSTVNIAGTNAVRTAASDAALATLISAGNTVTVNE